MAEIMYRDALRQALFEEMERDPTVFIMGENIGKRGGSYKVTEGLLAEFGPGRVMDTPLSEPAFTGAGVGAAGTAMPGTTIYQLTEAGLALQATLQGTKFWADDDLN